MYEEVTPGPPIDFVTQIESFRTANFSLPLGPWYPGDLQTPRNQLDTAITLTQGQIWMRQNAK